MLDDFIRWILFIKFTICIWLLHKWYCNFSWTFKKVDKVENIMWRVVAVVKIPQTNEEVEQPRIWLTCKSERHRLGGRPSFIGCQTCVVPSILWLGPSNGQNPELVQIQPAELHVCRSQGNCMRRFWKRTTDLVKASTLLGYHEGNFSVNYVI